MSYYKRDEPCTAATKAFYTDVKHYDFNKPGFSKNTRYFTQVNARYFETLMFHSQDQENKTVVNISETERYWLKLASRARDLFCQSLSTIPRISVV